MAVYLHDVDTLPIAAQKTASTPPEADQVLVTVLI